MYGPFPEALPEARPTGLRRRSLPTGTEFWRIDAEKPAGWSWAGFAVPRYRFDPAWGAFRTRYASTSLVGAARERYLDTGRLVPLDHASHYLARLVATRPLRVLDLHNESNLDALEVDDRISTSHEPDVLDSCHRLADAAPGWWSELDGILFRSRTTPETSSNLAFFGAGPFAIEARPLRTCADELDDLVLRHHFTIAFAY